MSTYDNMDSEVLRINNNEKFDRLAIKNYNSVEVKKILYGEFSELDYTRYVTRSEMDRIIRLNDFFRNLSYTKQEMNALIDDFWRNGTYLDFVINNRLVNYDGYYKSYYNKLIFVEDDSIDNGFLGELYKFVYKYGCMYLDDDIKKIVVPKKIMYYIDGKPIVFMKCSKPIITVEDARDFRNKNNIDSKRVDMSRYFIDTIIDLVNKDFSNISVEQFMSLINESGAMKLSIIYKDILNRLDGDKDVIIKLHKEDERCSYISHIREIYKMNKQILSKILNSKFNCFTQEELKVIISMFPYENAYYKDFFYTYVSNCLLDDDIINNIDAKCDFKYLKLLSSLKLLKNIERIVDEKENLLTSTDFNKMRKLKIKEKKY